MGKIHYSIYSEQRECTQSYSCKPRKNNTVDIRSSDCHSMSKWANQCKRSFQENENEADDVQKWQRTWLEMRWKHSRTEYSWPNHCKKNGIPYVPIATVIK